MSTDFALQVQSFMDRAKQQVDRIVLASVLELRTRIIVRTPVDTGRLRNNWQLGVDSQPAGNLDYDPKRRSLAASAVPVVAAQNAAFAKAGQDHTYYLVNNLPYARRQEYGFIGADSLGRQYWQWGRNFVGRSVAEWPQIVAAAVEGVG